MKVLHLPFNMGSMMAATVRAQRSLGVDARGLARRISILQDYSGLETIEWANKPQALVRLGRSLRWRYALLRALSWAEVVHWHWAQSTWKGLDLRIVQWLGKPALVEFYGDDVRVPEIAARDNVYIARMYAQNPELVKAPCGRWLEAFAKAGFSCLVTGFEVQDYLDPSLFRGYYQTIQRLEIGHYPVHAPDPKQRCPRVVHAPSDRGRKGTEAVLRAVEILRQKYEFSFELIQNMARPKALDVMKNCDLFLDQFTVGAEGLAAHEAMAFAKPVVCFIKDSIRSRYSEDFPIVSATQDSLLEVLPGLLTNGPLRHQLGLRGRAYVEAHNDARKLGTDLLEIYQDLQARRRGRCLSEVSSCRHWRSLPPAHRTGIA